MTDHPQLLLGSFVYQERSDLLEWIAHHRATGITEFHIFTDRRRLKSQPLLRALSDAGAITLHPMTADPEAGEELRNSALRFAEVEAAQTGGYGLFLADDEYLCVQGGRAAGSLLQACENADVIELAHQTVGCAGHDRHQPGDGLRQMADLFAVADPLAEDSATRSLARLGRFRMRSLNIPAAPIGADKVTSVQADGTALPAPFSHVAWRGMGITFDNAQASVLKLAAPSVETAILRAASLPERQQPKVDDFANRLKALSAAADSPVPVPDQAKAIAKEMKALLALSGVKDAQDQLCAQELATLETLRSGPSELAQLLTPAQPAAAPARDDQDDTADGLDDAPAPAQLPEWFAEIHMSGSNAGFYTRLQNHALAFIQRDTARLVVSFDNLSNVNDMSATREPWAYKFVRENGCSHLTVMARRKDWFRDAELIAYLQKIAGEGFFARFDQVFMTGTSMGGFAALAFASLAPGATVISFNPQTTLDATLVPWEERFGIGQDRDWSLPHSDCAFEIDEIDKAFVFYDPFFIPDSKHVARLEGDNVYLMKTWCSGHFSPTFLRRADLLKPIMQHALDGTLTPALFYKLIRARRTLPWYRKGLKQNLTERGHDRLAERVTPAFRKLKREAAQ
ncbi:MAG: glycosyltransferase family 92 protein [Yoonia sp.]|uniref:glycosyltransferase family 92 protein n=1 Tax=Yoonia sp. TaxID=2212373 RepID=UPI003EF0F1F8